MEEENYERAITLKQSKFNSTISILYRIDALWQDTHKHSRSGKLKQWNWDLDRVWCELAADANDEHLKKFKELNESISKINISDEPSPVKFSKLYQALLDKEIFLRKLQNEEGKGTAYDESLEEYMD